MGRNLHITLHLEVTVPRIVLPTPQMSPRQRQQRVSVSSTKEEEQVHLSIIDQADRDYPIQTLQPLQSAITTHENGTGTFRLFLLKYVTTPGNRLLLKLLRRQTIPLHPHTAPPTEGFFVTDQVTFQIDTYQTHEVAPQQPIEVLPGLKRITIVFNEEHIPHNYYIDGAEH